MAVLAVSTVAAVLLVNACRHVESSMRVPTAGSGEQRAVTYLSREVPRWFRENQCYSCHNNGDGARALYEARAAGFHVPTQALSDTTRWLLSPERWDANRGDPSASDKNLARLQFAVALSAGAGQADANARSALPIAAARLQRDQKEDGSWSSDAVETIGSPVTYGTHLATAMALRTLRRSQVPNLQSSVAHAEGWLRQAALPDIPAVAGVLIGLSEAADVESRQKKETCWKRIWREQSSDGGWAPYSGAPAEVFDTAVVLLALTEWVPAEKAADTADIMQRGRAYLLSTQLTDGSWVETTRPSNGESYAQRISTTAWATLALIRTRASAFATNDKPRSKEQGD